MRSLSAASALALAAAQAPTWLGLRPSAASPGTLQLLDLTDGGAVNSILGTVPLGAGETPWPDAVRCLPGFCLFATTLGAGTASPSSFIYRISSADGTQQYKAACPGTCAHMHADYSTGHAYTLSNDGGKWTVVECSGAAPVAVADITAAVGGGAVAPGQTTHCSAFKSMYVGVNNGGGGKDVVLTVDLTAGAVVGTLALKQPLFSALWATCDGSGVIGGVSFTPGAGGGNGTATFGAVNSAGALTPDSVVGVPAGYVPSGLLTGTSPADYKDAFVAAFYPPGTPANSSSAAGYLWAVDPYGGGSDDEVTEFPCACMYWSLHTFLRALLAYPPHTHHTHTLPPPTHFSRKQTT